MGTRARTVFVAESGVIARLYRTTDGDPSDHGLELATLLEDAHIIRGIPPETLDEASRSYCGMGDVAVRTISALKNLNGSPKEPGGLYLLSFEDDRNVEAEWTYHVQARPTAADSARLQIVVWSEASDTFEHFSAPRHLRTWCENWSREAKV